MVRKLFFTLGWIGILALALLGIYVAIFPNYLYQMDFGGIIFRGILSGVSIFYILLFIEKILIIFEKSKDYEVTNENGKLVVSSSTISNLVKEVTSSNREFKNIKSKNKVKGKKLFIYITVDAFSDSDIAKNVLDTQEAVKKAVYEYLALEVDSVEVKVSKLIKRKGGSNLVEGSDL